MLDITPQENVGVTIHQETLDDLLNPENAEVTIYPHMPLILGFLEIDTPETRFKIRRSGAWVDIGDCGSSEEPEEPGLPTGVLFDTDFSGAAGTILDGSLDEDGVVRYVTGTPALDGSGKLHVPDGTSKMGYRFPNTWKKLKLEFSMSNESHTHAAYFLMKDTANPTKYIMIYGASWNSDFSLRGDVGVGGPRAFAGEFTWAGPGFQNIIEVILTWNVGRTQLTAEVYKSGLLRYAYTFTGADAADLAGQTGQFQVTFDSGGGGQTLVADYLKGTVLESF